VTRKVIYICFGRLTDKMARDWYIDFLIDKGVKVEYWDIVALVREEHAESSALNADYLRVFRSFSELEQAVAAAENRDALYVMLLSYAGRLARVFRLLSRHRRRMLYFAWGALPQQTGRNWRRLAAWAATPLRLAREVFYRSNAWFLRAAGLVAPFEIAFAAGAVSIAASVHAVRVVPINYFDYDCYVRAKAQNGPRLVKARYAVFLDAYLPFHSDFGFGDYARLDPERYYGSLNRFFGALESSYGIVVAIAAHPRADYDAARFAGRPTHRLATAELVRDCEFVLSHWSTATSYAVLNRKPVVFIHTDEIAAKYAGTLMRTQRYLAAALDAPICNVDEQGATSLSVRPANSERYERYKYDYLTSRESEGTSTQEIFWREMSAL
jgi:hypothetical protein